MVVGLIALALGAVVVMVGFSHIKLDALQEPSHLETVLATRLKHALIRRDSREGIPTPRRTYRLASKKETNSLASSAQHAMASTATVSLTPVAGCIRVPQTLPPPRYKGTPIANCSGL
jgi:hypothetical protein